MVLVNNKVIHFGSRGYSDYTQHKDPKRLLLYNKRHSKKENWNDIETAGFWAKALLWNKPTLKASMKDIEKRFKVRIYLQNV